MLDQETMRPLASLNLTSLLKEGRGFFLFDGLDEVSSPAARRSLRDAVHEGMRKYRRCRWLLTSPIIGYEEVPFHEISLTGAAGGTPDQQVQLRYLAPFDDARIRQFATNWYVSRASGSEAKRRSDVLVHAVFRDPSTTSLARVPFLLTLMATVHRNNITLPNGRALLYKLIAEAYVQKRVEAAGLPQRGFPPQQQWACLARVGVELQLRRRPGRAERDTFLYASPTDVREWLMGVLNRDAGARATSLSTWAGGRACSYAQRGALYVHPPLVHGVLRGLVAAPGGDVSGMDARAVGQGARTGASRTASAVTLWTRAGWYRW